MGYETKIFVVNVYDFTDKPKNGNTIASLELCKCGYDGPVYELFERDRKNPEFDFALYAFTPDRQQEAVDILREIAENNHAWSLCTDEYKDKIKKLSNDIEDGQITTDMYDDKLGVTKVPDLIAALEQEIQKDVASGETPYRRFEWALAMLKTIWDGSNDYERERLRVISYGH